ncbi:hypothetical protein [Limimaricola soesokkakensis]
METTLLPAKLEVETLEMAPEMAVYLESKAKPANKAKAAIE